VFPEDYKAVAVPEGVTGTVVVEASEWVEDNRWILDLAENEPFVVGFVGNLDPESDAFERHLTKLSANPLFRGIRLHRNEIATVSDLLFSKLELLVQKDLSLDLLIDVEQLHSAVHIAARLPDLRIVLNHVIHVPIDGKTPNPDWIDGLHNVAQHPNIYCKVSGLVETALERPAPSELIYYAPTLDHLWEILGVDRLIYASNWPVCEHGADYATVQRIPMEYFKAIGEDAVEKVFWKNAKAAYKWPDHEH
jgi:L-fuconolactonase